MTSEFDMSMTVKGTTEELLSILRLMKRYSDEEKGIYFPMARLVKGENTQLFFSTEDEKMEDLLGTDTEITIESSGPYGKFGMLSDIEFFEDMASAAPGAYFKGQISGGTSYTNEDMTAELKDGVLNLETFYLSNDEVPEAYIEYFMNEVPYERFVELFRLNIEDFTADDYEEFIGCELCYDESLSDMDYDYFIDAIGTDCDLDEEEFADAVCQIIPMTYTEFEDNGDYGCTEKHRYDPVARKYLDEDMPRLKSNTPVEINGFIAEYLAAKGLPNDEDTIAALSVEDVYSIMAGTYDTETPADTGEATAECSTDEAIPDDLAAVEEEFSGLNESEEPSAEEPAVEEPAAEKPAVEESVAEEPVAEAPAAVESHVEKAAPTKKRRGWIAWLILLLIAGGAAAAYFCCDAVAAAVDGVIAHILAMIQQ